MRQQLVVSGIGGQGVLFLTRVLAEAALVTGLPVLTSETHGMAMRGGTVISQVKVGGFHGPLIRAGDADVAFILAAGNLEAHRGLVRPGGLLFVNAPAPIEGICTDASLLAREIGSPVSANLVLLGLAAGAGALFCAGDDVEEAIRRASRSRHAELNLAAFRAGLDRGAGGGAP